MRLTIEASTVKEVVSALQQMSPEYHMPPRIETIPLDLSALIWQAFCNEQRDFDGSTYACTMPKGHEKVGLPHAAVGCLVETW